MEPNNKNDFVIEKMKQRPVSKRKLLKRSATTAFSAVMFGLIACLTFLLLEPIISNWLYPKNEIPDLTIPEEPEEMEPQEMLSDSLNLEEKENGSIEGEYGNQSNKVMEQQISDVLSGYTWGVEDYAQAYATMDELTDGLQRYIVTVKAQKSDTDWLETVSRSTVKSAGVIIANNGTDLLILTNYNSLKNADSLMVSFFNGFSTTAKLLENHNASDVAIVSVSIASMGEMINEIEIAPLGSSYVDSYVGTPIIALGNPVGEMDSVCYGMVIADKCEADMTDSNFEILVTDIYGAVGGTGFLFNLKGQIVGVITGKKPSADTRYLVTAFEIGDLKPLIFRLSNGYKIPYVGITATYVSPEVHEEGKVPYGMYVKNVDRNSPAMKAGIQPGDVVVGIQEKSIQKPGDYFSIVAGLEKEISVNFTIMRLVGNEFKEVTCNITPTESY